MAYKMHPYTYVAQNGKKRIHESYFDDKERQIDNYIEYNEDMSLPNELIKFYSIDNRFNCDAFLNNYLWAANPRSFNDPFDCKLTVNTNNTILLLRDYTYLTILCPRLKYSICYH